MAEVAWKAEPTSPHQLGSDERPAKGIPDAETVRAKADLVVALCEASGGGAEWWKPPSSDLAGALGR